jgi:menaquinone-dependent protoporphyrinogen oxidase
MLADLLIAYATRAGSTAEVAESLAASLREAGLLVEVQPMSQVESLLEWKALVIGAPLYFGRFPGEFHKFLARHREALELIHPWFFALGPTKDDPKIFEAARGEAEKELGKNPWLHLRELQVFGGKWDPRTMPFPFSLIKLLPMNPIGKVPASDIRDWVAIREWAQAIAPQVKSAA